MYVCPCLLDEHCELKQHVMNNPWSPGVYVSTQFLNDTLREEATFNIMQIHCNLWYSYPDKSLL